MLTDGSRPTSAWKKRSETHCFGSDGRAARCKRVIDGISYEFDSQGKARQDIPPKAKMSARAQQYTSSTRWLILVGRTNQYVGIFSGSKGDWTLRKYWICSLYILGTSIVMDGTMGVPSSHGCIRLYIDRAKWIHDNIPRDIRVVIYK